MPEEVTITTPSALPNVTLKTYRFKVAQEVVFAGLTALAILALETLAGFDPTDLSQQGVETYAIALGGSAARAFGAAALNVLLRYVVKG